MQASASRASKAAKGVAEGGSARCRPRARQPDSLPRASSPVAAISAPRDLPCCSTPAAWAPPAVRSGRHAVPIASVQPLAALSRMNGCFPSCCGSQQGQGRTSAEQDAWGGGVGKRGRLRLIFFGGAALGGGLCVPVFIKDRSLRGGTHGLPADCVLSTGCWVWNEGEAEVGARVRI